MKGVALFLAPLICGTLCMMPPRPPGHGPPGHGPMHRGPKPSLLQPKGPGSMPRVDVDCSNTAAVQTDVDNAYAGQTEFFAAKAELLCPTYRLPASDGAAFAEQLATAEKNMCFERAMNTRAAQAVPGYCAQLEDEPCGRRTCDATSVKKSYCDMAKDPKIAERHEKSIFRDLVRDVSCSDFTNTELQAELNRFIANTDNNLQNDDRQTTLTRLVMWNKCLNEYIQSNFDTAFQCESVTTQEERRIMQEARYCWGTSCRQSAWNLLTAAEEANNMAKYMCLKKAFKGTMMSNWVQDIMRFKKKQGLNPAKASTQAAIQTTTDFENGDFAAIGVPPGVADASRTVPTTTDLANYRDKIEGACVTLYPKYSDPTQCTAYTAQLEEMRIVGRSQRKETFMKLLKASEFDHDLAMCMIANSTNNDQDFCSKLSVFAAHEQIRDIMQNVQCGPPEAMLGLFGVNYNDLGDAIRNTDFTKLEQLKEEKPHMDPWTSAFFETCLCDNLWGKLQQLALQYQSRVDTIRAVVAQVNADTTLSKEEKHQKIIGALMQGGNKGDGEQRLAEVYAVVDASTTDADKAEKCKMLKMKLMMTLKKIHEYETLINTQCSTSNTVQTEPAPAPAPEPILAPDSAVSTKHRGPGRYGGRPRPPRMPHMPMPGMPFMCPPNKTHMMEMKACRQQEMCAEMRAQPCNSPEAVQAAALVDEMWQTLLAEEAAADPNFNILTSLKAIAQAARQNATETPEPRDNFGGFQFFWPRPPPRPRINHDTFKCATVAMANNLRQYWMNVDDCHVLGYTMRIMGPGGMMRPPHRFPMMHMGGRHSFEHRRESSDSDDSPVAMMANMFSSFTNRQQQPTVRVQPQIQSARAVQWPFDQN